MFYTNMSMNIRLISQNFIISFNCILNVFKCWIYILQTLKKIHVQWYFPLSPFLKQTAIRDISLFPGSKGEIGWNQTILWWETALFHNDLKYLTRRSVPRVVRSLGTCTYRADLQVTMRPSSIQTFGRQSIRWIRSKIRTWT